MTTPNSTNTFDLVILGGGPAGAALALDCNARSMAHGGVGAVTR